MKKQLFLDHFFGKKPASIISSDLVVEENTKKENIVSNNIDHTEEKIKVTLSNDVAISSDYEKLRRENMKRNADFLQSLGIHELKPTLDVLPVNDKTKKRKCKTEILPPSQLRRSSRTATGVVSYAENAEHRRNFNGGADDDDDDDDEEEDDDGEEEYVDAPGVYKYIVSSLSAPAEVQAEAEAEAAIGSCAYHLVGEPIHCEDLAATYSLEFHPKINGLLLAAGIYLHLLSRSFYNYIYAL
jgi:hypothetical protein